MGYDDEMQARQAVATVASFRTSAELLEHMKDISLRIARANDAALAAEAFHEHVLAELDALRQHHLKGVGAGAGDSARARS